MLPSCFVVHEYMDPSILYALSTLHNSAREPGTKARQSRLILETLGGSLNKLKTFTMTVGADLGDKSTHSVDMCVFVLGSASTLMSRNHVLYPSTLTILHTSLRLSGTKMSVMMLDVEFVLWISKRTISSCHLG